MDLKSIKLSVKKIEILNSMGIESVEDLLLHYPFRYDENTIVPFVQWEKDDMVFFEGVIATSPILSRLRNRMTMVRFKVMYEEEELEAVLFNRPWIQSFKVGSKITIHGKYNGKHKIVVQQYNFQPIMQQLGLIAVYSTKAGLHQKDLHTYMERALEAQVIDDFVPMEYIEKYRLLRKQVALTWVHRPQNKEQIKQAIRTLKYEEFLKFQLMMQYYKHKQAKLVKVKKQFEKNQITTMIESLPFELTLDQSQTIQEILSDLQSDTIMYRLVQGDVGSGKTLVAVVAMYACFLAGQQAAFLAPTEILAKQHALNVQKLLEPWGVRVVVLYASMPTKQKKAVLAAAMSHDVDVVVGTHALFQEHVQYAKLGLVIADEQHRFGVEQRRSLLRKGEHVDVLLMSATPIPRTLAASLYGDMDVSSIVEMPKGRKPIITYLVKENSMRKILKAVLGLIDAGNQCYVVCPAIEKNDEYAMRNVEEITQSLTQSLPSKYRIQMLHGKMSAQEKDDIMEAFLNKQFEILVSTSVIEVGLDVTNANIMIIYDAHRFGLSQIHQLRGRVGRGTSQGYCYLLSATKDVDSLKRLEIVVKSNDGFEIAKQDLLLRGPGDLLGKRQSGIPSFILGDIYLDQKILDVAREDAQTILSNLENYRKIKEYIEKNELTSMID